MAATATGAARTANTGSGSTRRVASNPAQIARTAIAVITTWRAVSPATSLSGSSTSAGTGTRWRASSLIRDYLQGEAGKELARYPPRGRSGSRAGGAGHGPPRSSGAMRESTAAVNANRMPRRIGEEPNGDSAGRAIQNGIRIKM